MYKAIIERERFIIKPLVKTDIMGLFELDRNPKVHSYLGNNPIKTENVILYIQRQYQQLGIGRWAIIEKSTTNFVG